MEADCIIVGAGIIGCTVAKALQQQGREVLLLDDGRPLSGTRPSGGHLKPSWFSSMPKTEYEPAMELLNDVWGLIEEDYVIRPTGLTTKVYRVDTEAVLATESETAKVTAMVADGPVPSVVFCGKVHTCRLLVIATGAWAAELVPGTEVTAKQGVSFRFCGTLAKPFIKPWSPYKQVVAHQQTADQVWVGDGSAILPKNWDETRTQACFKRCSAALPGMRGVSRTIGLRPYCKAENGDPCLLQRLGPRAWLATGAGKSGTIAAGWAARRIVDACID